MMTQSIRKYSAGFAETNMKPKNDMFSNDKEDHKKMTNSSKANDLHSNQEEVSGTEELEPTQKRASSQEPPMKMIKNKSNSGKKKGNIRREEVIEDGLKSIDEQGTLDSLSCYRAFYGLSVFDWDSLQNSVKLEFELILLEDKILIWTLCFRRNMYELISHIYYNWER